MSDMDVTGLWCLVCVTFVFISRLYIPRIFLLDPHIINLVAQTVKNLPAMQKTWVRSSDQEDPLEKGVAIHSCVLAWEIPWTEEPGGLQSMGSQRIGLGWATNSLTLTLPSLVWNMESEFRKILFFWVLAPLTMFWFWYPEKSMEYLPEKFLSWSFYRNLFYRLK